MSAFKALREWAATSTIAHVGFGFIAMGAWAVFANRDHTLAQALLAGLVQGAISGALTLVLKKFLEWMNARLSLALSPDQVPGPGDAVGAPTGERRRPEPVEGQSLRHLNVLIVPPLITAASILAILVAAHTLAGTPEIAATIVVPFTVSTSYAIIYNWGLWRRANGR